MMVFFVSAFCFATVLLAPTGLAASENDELDYHVEVLTALVGPPNALFLQSRAAAMPGSPPKVILTTQRTGRTGTHNYQDMYQIETRDLGRHWTAPRPLPSLRRVKLDNGYEWAIGDFWPAWHAATRTVLGTGKTFSFQGGAREDKTREQVSYSVHDAQNGTWSGIQIMAMPARDHADHLIREPNAGCTQRFDLPDGEILLPIRYRRGDQGPRRYTTIVARCAFDGKTLSYKKHGSELTIPRDRGLCEPSVTGFKGQFFLTMRADHSAFVARSENGIDYEGFREWTFDDGKPLGNYNTQQHWVAHTDGLFLIYTRKGAKNDHIFRHRAPLFMARVDPERLCVLRATERVLIPENNAMLGNFGVTQVSLEETWIITSEYPTATRQGDRNRVLVARILWSKSNR